MKKLTARESEVLTSLCHGRRNHQIASELYISPETVKSHLRSIYRKLGVSTRGEAMSVTLRSSQHESTNSRILPNANPA